jgi:hypothetical protein
MGVQGLQDWAQHFGFAGIARETRVPRGQRWTPIVSARHQESNNGCPGFSNNGCPGFPCPASGVKQWVSRISQDFIQLGRRRGPHAAVLPAKIDRRPAVRRRELEPDRAFEGERIIIHDPHRSIPSDAVSARCHRRRADCGGQFQRWEHRTQAAYLFNSNVTLTLARMAILPRGTASIFSLEPRRS